MPTPDVAPAEQTDVLSSNEQSQKIADRLADAQAKIANGTASDLDREIVAVFNTELKLPRICPLMDRQRRNLILVRLAIS